MVQCFLAKEEPGVRFPSPAPNMTDLQQISTFLFLVTNLVIFYRAYFECKVRKNSLGPTPELYLLGSFFWADAFIFSVFWILASLISLVLNSWQLFLLIISVFWLVRSLGEVKYWLNQQFSKINRNPPEKMRFSSYFEGDSIWFVYQIFWQCLTVFSLVATIYFSRVWLISMGY